MNEDASSNKNDFRICMLIARFYPYIGGTERQALLLSKSLISRGIKLFVVTERHRKNLPKYELVENVPVYRLSSLGKGLISSITFFISTVLFLIKRRDTFDIIHVHLASSPALAAILVSKILKKKTIIKFGGAGYTGDIGTSKRRPFGKVKLKIISRYGDMFVVPSETVKNELIEFDFPKDKIVKINNGVEEKIFFPLGEYKEKVKLRERLKLPLNNIILVYTGRLHHGKGIDWLVSIWHKIIEKHPNLTLLILGSGILYNKIADLIQRTHIEDKVLLLGEQKNVIKYLHASDVFVLPSFYEGFSNALLEGMSCGLPVIATNIGPNREIIRDGENGLLYTPGKYHEFVDKLEMLVSPPNGPSNREFYSKQSRNTVVKYYSISKITSEYIAQYKNLMNIPKEEN